MSYISRRICWRLGKPLILPSSMPERGSMPGPKGAVSERAAWRILVAGGEVQASKAAVKALMDLAEAVMRAVAEKARMLVIYTGRKRVLERDILGAAKLLGLENFLARAQAGSSPGLSSRPGESISKQMV